MRATAIARFDDLPQLEPRGALFGEVDLVLVRDGDQVSVFHGRCLHRGALLADGSIRGADLICGVHGWDYRYDTGISAYNNAEALPKFAAWVDVAGDAVDLDRQREIAEGDASTRPVAAIADPDPADRWVIVDADEIDAWVGEHPQAYDRDSYQGAYQDLHGAPEEPYVSRIRGFAGDGLPGHHGMMTSMGVDRRLLPSWDSIQVITAQLARRPLLDEEDVSTDVVIGPRARRPLALDIPLFVSDMSFGALSEEAKVALAKGAEMAGTGICSGEGGKLPEEHAENSRYLYELASGRFGWHLDRVRNVQAFHFKFGQGAKTGTGGHLPGHKVRGKIAEVRDLAEGTSAISPATFTDLDQLHEFRDLADEVREASDGVPIGAKLSAQHIEADLDAALEIGVDYVILDGRGGGTGAAPTLFRDHISVPTIPAIARARRHLDAAGVGRGSEAPVTLVATGGLRIPPDFVKAMALGADAIALSNAAMQAIGCLGMRACNTNECPVGIATQQPGLRRRLVIDDAAGRLATFLTSSAHLMSVLARACGHDSLRGFAIDDLTTFDRDIHHLTGIPYGGVGAPA